MAVGHRAERALLDLGEREAGMPSSGSGTRWIFAHLAWVETLGYPGRLGPTLSTRFSM
jgi:hypothetical protein